MVVLGFQDTDWVGENEKEVLDAILLRDSLILVTLSMANVVILCACVDGLGP